MLGRNALTSAALAILEGSGPSDCWEITMSGSEHKISRVTRSKAAAKASYDRISPWYDFIAGSSEWKFVEVGLNLLDAAKGESILEIGYGTGKSVLALAQAVGETGCVCGIDISEGMYRIANARVQKSGFSETVELKCGDAARLPYDEAAFDAVFMSFTLELFDTPEIPVVLHECRRVLKRDGRIVVVSMAKRTVDSMAVRIYEWFHERLPTYVDCRPIYLARALSEAGFRVLEKIEMRMWGLPVDLIKGE
jgi:demethylmenaquinone methyltransferase/2-methoxy-6-polyprenyl-1,4-benzoquinol methylase